MFTIHFTRYRTFICFLFILGYFQLFGQEKLAQPGMTAKANNLTSFPISEVKHLEEWKKNNLPGNYNHPEFGLLPENAPCENCVEVLDKRTIDERYFVSISDNQEFYSQKALGDLHQLVNGKWLTIQHTLHPVSETRFESGYLLDQPAIDFSSKRTELKTANGTIHFNNWKLVVVKDGIEMSQLVANWSDYTIGADGALIHNVFPGIDAEMVVLRGAIKTSFIINSNEFGVFDKLVFRDELGGLTSIQAQFEAGNYTQGIGNLKLMDGSTELAIMNEAKLFAKNGPKDLAHSGVYSIQSNIIDLLVDYNWINDNIDAYQLIVDPLVTATATLAQASITGSRYNASCNFTNSCDYNLAVASPANATITNVTFSFNYSANGTTCWLQDGGVRIGTGACTSPSAAGFYWFCNAIGGGTCTATNQSVFSDISTCLPAPSCSPQNIPFILKFYRSCWGATGCSNTCIGAASPWVMNITGQTLAYTNTVNNTTVSATTVCQGGNITASTSGTWGVPGYTYNWSFSPTGLPSVGSGASTTITFPTAGTITLYSFVTDACGNVVTSSRTITVTAGPVITATPSTQTICTGQSTGIALSSTISNTTYSWTVVQSGVTGASNGSQTGNAVSIIQALTTTGSVPGTATYTITPTVGGCTGSPITVVVTVNPNLPASVSIAASATSICTGSSVTFTATPTNGGAAPTYQWFVNGNPVAGQTASTFTSTTLTTGASVTVQMTSNATPCLTASPATSNAIPITVSSLIVPSVSVSASTTTACTGTSITFTATPTNGGTAPTYQWFVNGNPVAGQTASTFSSTTLTNGESVTVQMTSNATPCLSTPTATSTPVVITINPSLTAAVSISSSASTICQGASVTFTATPTNGGTVPTYQWFVNGNPVVGQTAATFTSTSLANGASVTVQMTSNATPCLIGSPGTSNAINLTVNPVLIPAVSVVASSTTICAGSSITFTTTPTNGGAAPTYQWFVNGNPVAGQTASTFTSTALTNGASVTVQMTSNATPCLSPSSATSSPIIITVNPSITASVSINASATTICAGDAITFTATPTNGGTAPNYQWFVNGNPVAGQTASTFTSTTLTNGASVTVEMTSNATPCLIGSPATSNSINLTVNPVLIPAVAVVASSTTICAGSSITFTATPTNGGAGPTYQWFVNGNPVAGQTASTFTSTTLTNGASVTVQMTSNATPCLSPSSATSSPITITVNPSITASVSINATATTICAGDAITFTATPTNGGTAPTYQWFVNGNPVAGQTASTFTSTTLTNGASVTVQMTSNATPCLIGSPATSNAIVITVNPILTPAVSITATSTTICAGTSVTFTATPTNGGTIPTYQWYLNGGIVVGQTSASFSTNTLNNGDVVTVELTSNATPCLATTTVISNAITIVLNPDIIASVSIVASTNTICSGSSVTFTATPTNGGAAPTYQWFVNGNPVAGQTASTFTSTTLVNGASVTVQMTSNATPCLAGSPATSNAEVIVVNPIPVITASNNGPLCVSEQLDLNVTNIAGAVYSWTGPQLFVSVIQNPSISNVTLSNAGTYNVTVNLNGCAATASTTVTIGTGTAATINPAGPFCVNSGVVTLTASAPNGVWSGPGITNPSTGTFDPTLATIGINTISYTTPGACGGTSTMDIVILPIPTVSISSNITTGCSPLLVTFTDNSVPASASVVWDFGNGETSSTSTTTTYTSTGCYDVTLTSTNAGGCSNTFTFNDFVCVLADPIADFYTSSYSTSMYDPSFQFVNQSTNAVSYSWNFGNGTSSSVTNPSVTYSEDPGSYTVQLVAYNAAGCTDTTSKIVTVTDELIFFVPNSFTPNGDEFNNAFSPVFTSGFDPYEFSFTIFNRWGETVFESKDATIGWDGTYHGEIVPEGVYTWTVRMKDIQSDKKYTFSGHLNVLK